MNSSSWKRIEEIYGQVLDAPPDRRQDVLGQLCGPDLALRQEVESLLAANEAAGDFLSRPARFPLHGAEPGTRMGPYEIEALLGAGAMGEVYRARDTRLDRPVALKLLGSTSNDPARVARFQQEAKAASALNHPSIAAIYEIGQSGPYRYIAQELVEGVTLRDQITAGTLSSEQAVDITLQCCAALGAAHKANVIHRDIKPENIIVRPDGVIKIVDFGLARILESTSGADVQATQTGTILGTPRYMSPEQARGEKLDARTDIFSLGAVLYEMIVGRAAFPGGSIAEVFAALLGSEPYPQTGTPFDAVIGRALTRDRETRLPDMERFAAQLRAVDTTATRHGVPARVAAILGVAAAAVVVVMFTAWQWRSSDRVTPQGPRFVTLTTFGGLKDFPALSPDGSRLAFSWRPPGEPSMHIYVRATTTGERIQLTSGPGDDMFPAWSADGSQIAFCRRESGGIDFNSRARTSAAIYVVAAAGGEERRITDAWAGVSWSADGKWLALARVPDDTPTGGGVELLNLESGQRRRLTHGADDMFPVFSPDGSWVAFMRSHDDGAAEIHIVPSAGGAERRLTADGAGIAGITWTADSREIVFSSSRDPALGRLWRVPVKGGPPVPIAAGQRSAVQPSIARQGGRLAFTESWQDQNLYLRSDGNVSPVAHSTRVDHSPAISPDGATIAFVSDRSGTDEIWLIRRGSTQPTQLARAGKGSPGSPRWSPDGRKIAYDIWAPGESPRMEVMNVDGSQGRPLWREIEGWMPAWSHDGGSIYFTSRRSGRREIWKIPAVGGEAVQVTAGGAYEARPSLDGRTIYYTKPRGDVCCEVWSVPADGGPEAPVAELNRRAPFSRSWGIIDGGIYFVPFDDAQVPVLRVFDPATNRATDLARFERKMSWIFPSASLTRDRRVLVYSQIDREVNDLIMIENFR